MLYVRSICYINCIFLSGFGIFRNWNLLGAKNYLPIFIKFVCGAFVSLSCLCMDKLSLRYWIFWSSRYLFGTFECFLCYCSFCKQSSNFVNLSKLKRKWSSRSCIASLYFLFILNPSNIWSTKNLSIFNISAFNSSLRYERPLIMKFSKSFIHASKFT